MSAINLSPDDKSVTVGGLESVFPRKIKGIIQEQSGHDRGPEGLKKRPW
jgi:hypothetical protein